MSAFAATPEPPYYAVIFTSLMSDDTQGYAAMAERMLELAAQRPGFLGVESARETLGITVSYWRDRDAITAWKQDIDHRHARQLGRERWYAAYRVRIAYVEREYPR
ncbi:antibiotic biosynthesis monooxygenase family protein [Salinicola aestuarinus]|uniref:antibiotic biosynthesis monooxygenase family protein n=1 Tax=Salinicola aestuarinus TaxID=1949082 RepID=UPI000DA16AFD|nr:antibiotic biosynthesis monooxygenase [Salinicola aestuarinus]